MIRLIFFLALLSGFSHAGPAVHERVLDNGLKVLVKEDHRAPVVVSQIWYQVGGSYEFESITGVSHILEHMMFKGTKIHASGDFSRIIAENGGRENAFTGRDYTAYFQRLEKSRLRISFELEADRMRNLQMDPTEFEKEREVVLEERRTRTDDKPRSKAFEYFLALAHTNGGYRNPVIGWAVDIRGLHLADLQEWYERWYAPNNATLVVAGDVDPEAVFLLAEEYFGPLPSGDPVQSRIRTEVKQLGPRRMTIRLPGKLPYLIMGYKVPVLKTVEKEKDAYSLEVLAGILDGGNSARLAGRLVRGSQMAISAGAGYDLYARMGSLFMLEATPAEGYSLSDLETALKSEIRELKTSPVAPEELARVKAQVLANSVFERDSVFYQAMQLGMLETVGLGWKRVDEYEERISQVTAEDILASAKQFLIEDNLTVCFLDPLPMDLSQADESELGGVHDD